MSNNIDFAENWLENRNRWKEVRDSILFPVLKNIILKYSPFSGIDLGCGDGNSTYVLLDICKNVSACDNNQYLLDCLNNKNINKFILDLSKPFYLEKYDIVLCCSVFMFLSDSEVDNVLKCVYRNLGEAHFILSFVHPEWTYDVNVEKWGTNNYEPRHNYDFSVGWNNVNDKLYYRPIDWYVNKISSYYDVVGFKEIIIPDYISTTGFKERVNKKVFAIFDLLAR